MFCGANVEEEIINEVPVAEESVNEFATNDELDIAVGKMVSDEEFGVREQRYTREHNPPREYRQTREQSPPREYRQTIEQRPIREESYGRPYDDQRIPRPIETRAGKEDVKKKGLKPLFILVPLLILALVVAGWAFMGMQSTRAFNDAMEQGNRYLLAMDLEQAEAHFLRAVEISPREVEPYLLLADVYMLQDEVEQAIDILEQGMDVVSESDRELLEDKLEDVIQGVQPEIVQEVEESEEVEEAELVPHTPSVPYFNRILSEYQWAERGNFVCDFSQPWFRNDLLRFDDSYLYYAFIDMTGSGTPKLFIAEIGNGNFDDYNIIGIYGIINGNVQPIMERRGFGQNIIMETASFRITDLGENVQISLRYNGGIVFKYDERTVLYRFSDFNEQFDVTDGTLYKVKGVTPSDDLEPYRHGLTDWFQITPISEEEYYQALADIEIQYPKREDIEWLRLSTAEIDFGEGVDHDNPFAGILVEISNRTFGNSMGGRATGETLRIDNDGLLSGNYWCRWSWEDNNGEDITSSGRISVDEKIDDFTYRILLLEYQRIGLYEGHDKVAGETIIYLFLTGRDISNDWGDFVVCSVTHAFLRTSMGLEGYTEHHGIAQYELPISLPFHALQIRFFGEFWDGMTHIDMPYFSIRDEESNGAVEDPALTDAEARHQRIMNGDFSDFAGTFTSGHGERLTLHNDGSITYSFGNRTRTTVVSFVDNDGFFEARGAYRWETGERDSFAISVIFFPPGIPIPYVDEEGINSTYVSDRATIRFFTIIGTGGIPNFQSLYFRD